MIDIVKTFPFLEDITDSELNSGKQTNLFKNMFKIYKSKHNNNIYFKMSSDWEGNWFAGHWYYKNRKINSPEELLYLLDREDLRKIVYNLDDLEKISSWGDNRYLNNK